jgi:hypothetical protein
MEEAQEDVDNKREDFFDVSGKSSENKGLDVFRPCADFVLSPLKRPAFTVENPRLEGKVRQMRYRNNSMSIWRALAASIWHHKSALPSMPAGLRRRPLLNAA